MYVGLDESCVSIGFGRRALSQMPFFVDGSWTRDATVYALAQNKLDFHREPQFSVHRYPQDSQR